jgi:ATP-dependent exoDNAse (exonuclease V) beta subunit
LPEGEPQLDDEPVVDDVLTRLTRVYPFTDVTSVRAAVAAGEFYGAFDFTRYPEQADPPPRRESFHVPPTKYAPLCPDDGLHRGILVHSVLEHLDYRAVADRIGLVKELQRMTSAGLIRGDDAATIDLDALAWFVTTPLAAQIRAAGDGFRREFAFVAAEPVSSPGLSLRAGQGDFVMVRGIIDGILSHGDCMSIIDFKTDAVGPEETVARADRYRHQLQMYARAARRLWGLPVPTGHLVFLSARSVCTLELSVP